MSNIYILSNELCDFCNVPYGSKMHIKQIVRKIEDYIINSMFDKQYCGIYNPNKCFVSDRENSQPYYDIIQKTSYKTLNKHFSNKIKIMYLDEKLKKIFINVPTDDYIINIANELARKNDETFYKRFTHNFDDIDMYLEISGHLTPVLKQNINEKFNRFSDKINTVKQEFSDTLNKISNKIDTVKQEFTETINKVSNNIDTVKQEFTENINKVSTKLENVKSLVSFSNDAENELIEVNKLLKELEEMYNSK
jgi:methyl-accepting chemotaxis protein